MKRHLIALLALTCLGTGASLAQVPQGAQHVFLRPIHPVSYVRPTVTHSAGFLTANKTPSNYDGSYLNLRPQYTEPNVDDLPYYNPTKDKTPKEHVVVKETHFLFRGKLQVRPETDHIVIHHVAIPSGDYSAQQIHRYHQDHNGWAGIGYHYVIRRDGSIERGRPLATVGAQASGENLHSIGICMAGNFDQEKVEEQQYNSLVKLVADLVEIYQLPLRREIVGHRDYNDTSCPGENLYNLLPSLRQDVEKEVLADRASGRAITSKEALVTQERAQETAKKNQAKREKANKQTKANKALQNQHHN